MLFVDDDDDTRELYEYAYRNQRFGVLTAASALHGLDILSQHALDIRMVVSDYTMPGMNGVAFLNFVREFYPTMGRILLTGEVDASIVVDARSHHRVLFKGMEAAIIFKAILREAKRYGG